MKIRTLAVAAAFVSIASNAQAQEAPDCNAVWAESFSASAVNARQVLIERLQIRRGENGTWAEAAAAYETDFRTNNADVPLVQQCPNVGEAVLAFTGVSDTPVPQPRAVVQAVPAEDPEVAVAEAAVAAAAEAAEEVDSKVADARAPIVEPRIIERRIEVPAQVDLSGINQQLAALNTLKANLEAANVNDLTVEQTALLTELQGIDGLAERLRNLPDGQPTYQLSDEDQAAMERLAQWSSDAEALDALQLENLLQWIAILVILGGLVGVFFWARHNFATKKEVNAKTIDVEVEMEGVYQQLAAKDDSEVRMLLFNTGAGDSFEWPFGRKDGMWYTPEGGPDHNSETDLITDPEKFLQKGLRRGRIQL